MKTKSFSRPLAILAVCLTFVGFFQHSADQRSWSALGAIPAFSGAEGFGVETVGGRGGQVIFVTNTNDSGTGSLRACVSATGPRICVFRTGGTIELASSLDITSPFLTIAGQTAPGGGITLKSGPSNTKGLVVIRPTASDVVFRYIRIRTGQPANVTAKLDTLDALTINSSRVVLDHVSLSWGIDETLNTWYSTAQNITVQWSIISEGLSNSLHPQGEHSKGWLMGDFNKNLTSHHNLFAHNMDRHPEMKGDPTGVIEVINNVIYNPGWRTSLVSDDNGPARVNYIGNYIKSGPSSPLNRYELEYYNASGQGVSLYVKGNIGPHRQTDANQAFQKTNGGEWSIVSSPDAYLTTTRHPGSPIPVTLTSAQVAYNAVLAEAGASKGLDCAGNFYSRRDAVDQRIVQDVLNGTGKIIDNQDQVGGWPVLAPGTPCVDTDLDGMSDVWEQATFGSLTRGGATDSSSDFDTDGYTDLEEFLNGTNPKSSGNAGNATVLSITLLLHGIGKGGDNVNASSLGNMNPLRSQRQVTVELFNSSNTALPAKTGTVTFQQSSGYFTGTVDIGSIPSGVYTMKIASSQYLKRSIPGIVTVTAGQTVTLSGVRMITGDSNVDNKLSILDYNIILDCFSDLSAPRNCADTNKKLLADLTDDGSVNQFDYNLFLRELSVQSGDEGGVISPLPTSQPTAEPTATRTPSPTVTRVPSPTVLVPTATQPPSGATVPAQVLNLTNWKITLPTGSSGSPTEIKQPALATFKVDPWFIIASGGSGVRFRSPVNGVTTSGSSYPRSELREMINNGTANAAWSSTTGTHTMFIEEAITAIPTTKKHVVAGQIHDANDDVIVIRLEYPKLFIDINGSDGPTLDANYTLGKKFTVKFVVNGGKTSIFYNGSTTPAYTLTKNYSGAYFKAGAYTQSNCSTEGSSSLCNNNNFGEMVIYQLTVTHQ